MRIIENETRIPSEAETQKLPDNAAYRAILQDQVAENMAIQAGRIDEEPFRLQAGELMRRFEIVEGRLPADYLEIEQWSLTHLDKSGSFLVIK
jgi:hypothetical protein